MIVHGLPIVRIQFLHSWTKYVRQRLQPLSEELVLSCPIGAIQRIDVLPFPADLALNLVWHLTPFWRLAQCRIDNWSLSRQQMKEGLCIRTQKRKMNT